MSKEGKYNNLGQGYKEYRAKASQIQSESQKQFEAIHVICWEVAKLTIAGNIDLKYFREMNMRKKRDIGDFLLWMLAC